MAEIIRESDKYKLDLAILTKTKGQDTENADKYKHIYGGLKKEYAKRGVSALITEIQERHQQLGSYK